MSAVDDVTQTPVKSTSGASLDEQVAQSLYAQRERVYPREVHGLFATMRVLADFTGVLRLATRASRTWHSMC